MLRLVRLPAAVLGVLLLAPAVASAENTFSVGSCHGPQPNAALGWIGYATGQGATSNTCAAGGMLRAELDADAPSGNSTAGWRFTAPAGTSIVRVRALRATKGFAAGPSSQENDSTYMLQTNDQTLEICRSSRSSSCIADLTAPFDAQGLNANFIEFQVLCTNGGLACTRRVSVDAAAVSVALADPSAPAVANANVIDNGDRSGTLRVRFDAADVGGGLYRALIKVDGAVAQTVPLGPEPCVDANPADSDPYQFTVPVPCPLAVTGAEARVNVRSLPAGPHGVEIAVEDAAGNQTSVHGPVEFPRLNLVAGSSIPVAQAIRARLRMWFVKARNRGRRYTSRYGTRVVTRGLLRTRSGRGIQGARIDVYHIRDGKRRLLKTGLKTRAKGRLTLILPLDVDTRHIEYAYRALRPGPVTSRQKLRLIVRTKSGRVYHRKSKR